MNAPSTPSQLDGGVDAIILRLNQRWRLSLPIRDYNLSPEKAKAQAQTDTEKQANKCCGCIKLLFYKDRAALERVITNFETVALKDTSVGGWLYKPNQEPGTLPRTSISGPSRDYFLARNDISGFAGISLMQKLLQFLESEAEPAKARLKTSPRPAPSLQPLPAVTQPTLASTNILEPLQPTAPNVQARQFEPMAQFNFTSGTGPAGLSNQSHVEPGPSRRTNDHPALPQATTHGHTVLYPQLEAPLLVPSIERDVPASIQSHEQVHSDDYGSTPDFEGILQDTDTSSSRGAENVDIIMEEVPPIMSERRAGKQPARRREDDSDEDVYFTSQESPPSPSTDRETRRQAKASREATKRPTIKKTEEWVEVIVSPPSSSRQGQQMSKNSRASRKRSSLDYAASTRRKASRSSVDEASPVRVQVKVNNHQVQDHLPLGSRTQHPPPVPLFPSATSANSSFTTNPNTSFGESTFSASGGGTTANTSFNSNFDDTFDSPQAVASSHKDAARTRVKADPSDFSDEEEILRENDLNNMDAISPIRAGQTAMDSPQLSQPLRSMGITSPTKPTLQSRLNASYSQGVTKVKPNSMDSGKTAIDQYLAESLFQNGPFSQRMPLGLTRCHLRTRYEIYRVSLHCGVPMNRIATIWPLDTFTYVEMWSWFQRTQQLKGKALPERSSEKAWENASKDFTNVVLSGELLFNEKREGPLFSFRLNPLKVDLSCRLFRRFGSDRFLALTLPSLSDFRLPGHIQKHAKEISDKVINWLVKGNHEILGRTWKAFYVKDGPKIKKQPNPDAKKKDQPFGKSIVYFFAVDGVDFCNGTKPPTKGEEVGRHSRMSLHEMLEWLIPFEPNKEQTCCKVFSRLALALSKTRSSIVFRPDEIRRIPDTYSSVKSVMNDGCARISRPAARAIAGIVGIEGSLPSCFQGRICGAKGLWMVATFEEDLMIDGRGFWIEITDSQLKFENAAIDAYLPDEDRVTFEVHSWSKPLNKASLNFQLLPILEGQGVPRQVIAKHLEDDLDLLIAEQLESMEDPLSMMQWNCDLNDSVEERVRNSGVQFSGGLPVSSAEQMNFLLESGFLPKSCWFLRDLAWRAVKSHCDRLKEKLNISIGRSCYAYCIADPLGILEEGEVHLGFSNTFKDGKFFEETELHDVDVLVARLPAALPSDVQKVRAVYKIELRSLKDVIIFSVKGDIPLAEKLSGGDYDGDKPWICWDPDIVKSFSNAPLPATKPSPEEFGITQDKTKWKDLPSNLDERATEFVLRGVKHSLEKNMLGECTTYHAKLCYRDQTVKTSGAIQLGILLGLLVDRAKQGYTFTQESWERFQKRICPGNRPAVPAYIRKDASLATNHIIDYLVFQIANPKITDALKNFWKELGDVVWWDADLNKVLSQEREFAKRDEAVRQVLSSLSEDIEKVFKFWNENVGEDSRTVEFSELIRQTQTMFEAILPANFDLPTVNRWRTGAGQSEFSNWRLLRASAAYSKHYKKKFVWWVAGRELGHMKAMSCKRGYRMVITPIHAFLKPNSRYLRLMKRKGIYGTNFAAETEYDADEEEEEETDFGSSIFGYEDWFPEAL